MTKRVMEQKANRRISSNMMVEESEQHLEVLRSYGFQFGKKTGSRFIAAVHEIVGIVAKEQIAEMLGTILALQLDVNDLNGRLIEQTEKTKSAENLYDEIQKKLEVVESDLSSALEAKDVIASLRDKEMSRLNEEIAELKARPQIVAEHNITQLASAARKHAEKNPRDQMAQGAYHAYCRCLRLCRGESEPEVTMSMCADRADYEAKVADATPMAHEETINREG